MNKREKINVSSLEFGDIALINGFSNNPLSMRATGLCIFIDYVDD